MRKLSFFLVLMMLIQIIPANAQITPQKINYVFADVPENHINADAIEYLKTSTIVSGYPGNDGNVNYKPENKINRAEFAKILSSAVLNTPEAIDAVLKNPKYKNCFSDVREEWFAPWICSQTSYLEGYPDGKFHPEAKIKFSEAAKIIAKAFKLEGDKADPQVWYKDPVTALEKKNDIPLSVQYFDEYITRDEMAEMIYRLKTNVTEKASRTYDEITGEDFVMPKSCEELEERYESIQYPYLEVYEKGDIYMTIPLSSPVPSSGFINTEDAPAGLQNSMDAAESTTSSGSGNYSTTNVQVEGVDEADIVKNDGKYIYLVKGNSIRIIEAYPVENLKELVSYTLGAENEYFYPNEMYVDGNTLAVMGMSSAKVSTSPEYPTPDSKMVSGFVPPMYNQSRAKIFILDITDRSKPSVKRAVAFDSTYQTSRKIGDTVYMVMNRYPYYPYYYDYEKGEYVKDSSQFLPKMHDSIKTSEELVAPCEKIRILPKSKTFNFLITAAVPLKDLTKDVTRSVLVGNSENVYASMDNLYVVSTDWTDGFYREYQPEQSAIYKFALGDGQIRYETKGRVAGRVLNQFSMDEYQNHFRIATTKNNINWAVSVDIEDNGAVEDGVPVENRSSNNLYILDENLKLTGKIENMAPGENIYSTRFMGKRAYMVTFRQVDPLFVLDVADPENPKILGTLKIPGYSTYLHPYDENHIIGFGKDVEDISSMMEENMAVTAQNIKGLKMGMFDVTDVNNPKEMFNEVIGDQGSDSEALYNHKALLFDKTKNLLAFPVSVTEKESSNNCNDYTYTTCPANCQRICVPTSCKFENGVKVCTTDCDGTGSCTEPTWTRTKLVFQGAYVYNVDLQNGFTLKGKITHLNQEEQAKLEEQGYISNYEKVIQRILYIGENLYTVSIGAVKANALSNLEEKKAIELAGTTDGGPLYPLMER